MNILSTIFLLSLTFIYSNQVRPQQYEHLVLEGGGSKAVSYVGALLALKEFGYFKDSRYIFDKIGGTSAGCFVGFLISLDIRPTKLEKLVYKTDIFQNSVDFNTDLFSSKDAPEKSSTHTWFNTFLKTFLLITKAREVVDLWLDYDSPGLSTEEMFVKFLSDVILPLSPHKQTIENLKLLTFKELLHTTHHDLHCFATQLTDKYVYEFSAEKTPNDYVVKALYASMTLPGLFKPIDDGNGNTLVDGGLLYNFPITMNDHGSEINKKTLGLSLNRKPEIGQSLMSKSDVAQSEQKFKYNTISTIDYIGSIYSVIISRESLLYSRNPINVDRVVYLDSPIKTLDFNLDSSIISMAINKAYLNTVSFLNKQKTVIP